MTGTCNRTLHNLIDHLGCSLSDLEGTELKRIALKNGTYDPDNNGLPDGVLFQYDPGEEELNHIRWSEAFLTSVINDGFRFLHLERPDLFNCPVEMKLTPCTDRQTLPSNCLKFGGNIYTPSCECGPGTTATKVSDNQIRTANSLGVISCPTGADKPYAVENYSFNPNSPKTIMISPVPPAGEDLCVMIDCVGSPPCYDWDEDEDVIVGEGFNPMMDIYEIFIIQYALHRAFDNDKESATSISRADQHWTRALQIVTEGKASDYMFHHPDLYLYLLPCK